MYENAILLLKRKLTFVVRLILQLFAAMVYEQDTAGHKETELQGLQSSSFPPDLVIRDWKNGQAFRLTDAQTGVCVFGATGSGKTSGPAKHLAYGYLAAGFGGLVLCAKKEERRQWEHWAKETERTDDLIIINQEGKYRFNFLDWEASRLEEGGGLAINIVNLLDEISAAISGGGAPSEGGSGNEKFWEDALHHLNMNVVMLPLLAETNLTLPILREILRSAPYKPEQVKNNDWQQDSICFSMLNEAEKCSKKNGPEAIADYAECRSYWLHEFPNLSEKTRSIITLTFSMLALPLLTRPMRKIFSSDTNIKPEDTFAGKIIIVDLPVQEFRLVGRIANLAWKYCFQVAVLRRMQPVEKGNYLRPVFLWADEAQNFISSFDAEYQAVARSAGGCTVYLTQNRESYRRVLGNNDAVDSLLGNLQCKIFCQQSGETNEWAAKLLGERWIYTNSTNVGQSRSDNPQSQNDGNHSAGVTRSEQRRYYVEPSRFTTLKRGGALNNFEVEAIIYKGGHLFPPDSGSKEWLPYKFVTFNQR